MKIIESPGTFCSSPTINTRWFSVNKIHGKDISYISIGHNWRVFIEGVTIKSTKKLWTVLYKLRLTQKFMNILLKNVYAKGTEDGRNRFKEEFFDLFH